MLNLKNTLDGYLKDVEVIGNTVQDTNNLADIRSVGDKLGGQELYKIDVVSCGKNLLSSDLLDGEYINNCRIGSNGAPYSFNDYKTLRTFKEIPQNWVGKELVLGFVGCIAFYSNNSDSSLVSRGFQGSSFIIPQNAKYFRLDYQIYAEGKLQLEEGTVATKYEPYKGDKLEILSPVQLEKVGDVADRIVCKDGVWGVEKNVLSDVVEEISNFVYSDVLSNVYRFQFDTNINFGHRNRGMISSIIPYNGNISWSKDEEGVYSDDSEQYSHRLWVHIHKSKITNEPELYIREQLPIKVVYKNLNPTFIPLPHDQQVKLRTFAGQTNIVFNTEIAGQVKAQVPKSLGAVVNTHTEQIEMLYNALKSVLAGDMYSLATLLYPEDFIQNDNTEQDIMVIPE